ncbi:VanZ family protein [Flavobacterium sp. CYK-4]|uniref:VanZ family protein n=1 Tax=Flavobacterium lotistagni TaxID=2709660 RepID=UPI00140BCF26|nr:VanZ family protein [Flavobacterium lotistagni]NHM05851.1 VanZ family protein [Flavobacterium lotistagni]
MFRKTILLIIHPVFIYCVIAILECIPYESSLGKKVYHEMPKVGDNFKSKNEDPIYYYNGQGKYIYSSVDCYFKHGNPSWATSYKDGGIKTIDDKIAQSIPMLGDMCDDGKKTPMKNTPPRINNFFSVYYLLDNFSEISHLMSYLILTLSILFHKRNAISKYWFAFIASLLGGALLELIQEYFIEGRHASTDDLIRNNVGTLIAILIFWLLSKTRFYSILDRYTI